MMFTKTRLPWRTDAPDRILDGFPALVHIPSHGYAIGHWQPYTYDVLVDFGDGPVDVRRNLMDCWMQLAPRPKPDGATPHPRPVNWIVGGPTRSRPALVRSTLRGGASSYYLYRLHNIGCPLTSSCVSWDIDNPPDFSLSPDSSNVHFYLD